LKTVKNGLNVSTSNPYILQTSYVDGSW